MNLVQNPGFETNPSSLGQILSANLPNWSVVGSNALYPQGYAWVFKYATGSNGTFGLYNSSTPGTTGAIPAPPGGGGTEFYGVDSTFHPSVLSQTLTNLTIGKTYAVSFDWAASQQIGFSGATTDTFAVTFGATTLNTSTITLASQTFSGWQVATLDFVATATTETLSFVDNGVCLVPGALCGPGDSGGPPFSLLDNVSVTAVPEPSTWAMMILGFASLAFAGYRSRRKALVKA